MRRARGRVWEWQLELIALCRCERYFRGARSLKKQPAGGFGLKNDRAKNRARWRPVATQHVPHSGMARSLLLLLPHLAGCTRVQGNHG